MSKLSDYLELMKPRLIPLLLFVAIASMVVAKGEALGVRPLLEMVVLGFIGLGGSAALNNYFDRDIDSQMVRTASRPIPAGRVSPKNALAFGFALIVFSVALTAILLNPLTAFIIGLGAFLYVWFYTLKLKRNTPSAVVWGGLAGSIPALGGWAAVSNTGWLTPILIFMVVFFWQPSHFWSLALLVKQDYDRAGVPVLPVLEGEGKVVSNAILYNILVLPFTYLVFVTGGLHAFYIYSITVLNIFLIAFSVIALLVRRRNVYRSNYRFSLAYMFMFLLALIVGKLA
ncbi:MAG: heme o synthase [Thermoprotei archaeon]